MFSGMYVLYAEMTCYYAASPRLQCTAGDLDQEGRLAIFRQPENDAAGGGGILVGLLLSENQHGQRGGSALAALGARRISPMPVESELWSWPL